jgi:penicillin-binding protein 1C
MTSLNHNNILETRGSRRALRKWVSLALGITLSTSALFAIYLIKPTDITTHDQGTILLDRNSIPIRIVLDRAEQDYRPVELKDISPWAQAAIVSVEDQRFHRHPGIDPLAILRASGQNLLARRRISGASTLSTQVIRLREPRPRNWRTKWIEAIKALRLERAQDKAAILEAHLNLAPFGGNLTGIEAAARWYFDKAAADLNLAEAAMLAGLPQSPSRLRPDRNPEDARKRMQHVLERMQKDGLILEEQFQSAIRAPLDLHAGSRPFVAPHFADLVLQQTTRKGTLQTTLDISLQHAIESIAAQHEKGLRERNANRIAIVVMQVSDGAILSLTGSFNYFDTGNSGMVNAALARRSPGSALKPLIYALAIDQGSMTPATMLDDRPAGYRDINPANFDGQFRGNVTLRDALIQSLNIPAMKTVEHLGTQRVIDHLRTFGLGTLTGSAERYGTGIAIGGAEVRLLDLVAAYATLARGGVYLPPRFLCSAPQAPPRRVLSTEAAYIITDMLGGQERSHDLFGHIADARLPRAAWKTGTSSAYRDAWTLAWTPGYVIGVWIGNTDGSPTKQCTGANAAAPVAADILRHLHPVAQQAWFDQPQGIRTVSQPDGSRDLQIAGVTTTADRRKTPDAIRITTPADGTRLSIPHTAPTPPSIPLQAESGHPLLFWFANGIPLGQTAPQEPLYWPLRAGTHNITCTTPCGQQSSITLIVDG